MNFSISRIIGHIWITLLVAIFPLNSCLNKQLDRWVDQRKRIETPDLIILSVHSLYRSKEGGSFLIVFNGESESGRPTLISSPVILPPAQYTNQGEVAIAKPVKPQIIDKLPSDRPISITHKKLPFGHLPLFGNNVLVDLSRNMPPLYSWKGFISRKFSCLEKATYQEARKRIIFHYCDGTVGYIDASDEEASYHNCGSWTGVSMEAPELPLKYHQMRSGILINSTSTNLNPLFVQLDPSVLPPGQPPLIYLELDTVRIQYRGVPMAIIYALRPFAWAIDIVTAPVFYPAMFILYVTTFEG